MIKDAKIPNLDKDDTPEESKEQDNNNKGS